MSLNFDLSKVKNYSGLVATRPELVRDIIFQTMSVGMNQITNDNCVEFYGRLKTQESRFGITLFTPDGKKSVYTLDTVRMFIGLKTNVSNMTTKEFIHDYLTNRTDHYEDESDLVDVGTFQNV